MATMDLAMNSLSKDSYRPATSTRARFGQLSSHSFFARHNPHPNRAGHIIGVGNNPICWIDDSAAELSQNRGNNNMLRYSMPVNSINIQQSQTPLDTISGLHYFTGMYNHSVRDKAVNQLSTTPVMENWRAELRALTENAMMPYLIQKQQIDQQHQQQLYHNQQEALMRKNTAEKRPIYSPTTGRLLPPPSRAMSRRSTRAGSRTGFTPLPSNDINLSPDMDGVVFNMLCQILQTEDINAVQNWLTSSNQRERNLVLQIIRSAVTAKDEYYHLDPSYEMYAPRTAPKTADSSVTLPPIVEDHQHAKADRLEVHSNMDNFQSPDQRIISDNDMRPPSTPFKPSGHQKDAKNNSLARIQSAASIKSKKGDNGSLMPQQATWNPEASTIKS